MMRPSTRGKVVLLQLSPEYKLTAASGASAPASGPILGRCAAPGRGRSSTGPGPAPQRPALVDERDRATRVTNTCNHGAPETDPSRALLNPTVIGGDARLAATRDD